MNITLKNISLEEITKKKSPFEGRTYISIYIPAAAPLKALLDQLRSEISRSQRSTNYQVKGVAIMMLNQIIDFLQNLNQNIIPTPGRILFSLPESHKNAYICYLKPEKGVIDLFTYNLDTIFYFDENYFP